MISYLKTLKKHCDRFALGAVETTNHLVLVYKLFLFNLLLQPYIAQRGSANICSHVSY